MIVVVGAGIGWLAAKYFTGRIAESERAEVGLPPSDNMRRGANKPSAEKRIAGQPTARVAATPKAPQPMLAKPAQTVARNFVSSYSPDLSYALSQWSPGKIASGFLDSVKIGARALVPADGMAPLEEDKVLMLSGWTGDRSIGVRYPYVLISACGKVVAHTAVNLARPDVAKAVHINLGRSGWRARIALRHLPGCKNLTLKAWAVVPGDRRLILPLSGQIAISVLPAAKITDIAAVMPASSPLRPADMKPLPPVRLNVTANTLNIRRCAGADCSIVGKLAKGNWTVLTLDDKGGWLLVATPDRAGWVSKRYVGVAQQPG